MFGYDNKKLYHISTIKKTFKKHVDLLLLSNSISFHYVLTKDFDRSMIIILKNIFIGVACNIILS